jgi:hypothetical protein
VLKELIGSFNRLFHTSHYFGDRVLLMLSPFFCITSLLVKVFAQSILHEIARCIHEHWISEGSNSGLHENYREGPRP